MTFDRKQGLKTVAWRTSPDDQKNAECEELPKSCCLETEPEIWSSKTVILRQQRLPEPRNTNMNINTTTTTTPPTIIDKSMPKQQQQEQHQQQLQHQQQKNHRNRKQTKSEAPQMPAVTHRKSKSKSKTKLNKRGTRDPGSVPGNNNNSTHNNSLTICAGSQRTGMHPDAFHLMKTIHSHSNQCNMHFTPGINRSNNNNNNINNPSKSNKLKKKKGSKLALIPLPTLGATSFVTLLTIICIETVLLSTMSSCAKTFYMHWNTSNSIFRIDNTDHIIDVNKGNLAFEFDQVHIICPVYEPGAFENETEKYIIYNVSKVEYETCRITNADPRVIAICDKPQKLMFFTITFRPFTPQPGGLEFLPGNDYYFISTSSKDDLYRRIGGRCSTNNMKVVFKVCCAAEEKNKTTETTTLIENTGGAGTGTGMGTGTGTVDNTAINVDVNVNGVNTIGVNTANAGNTGNIHLKPINGLGTSINTNIDQFNRIPIQPNIIGNNIGAGGVGGAGAGGVILSPGHGSINMLPPGRGGIHLTYPGHHHIQTGIRINNVPTNVQQNQNNPNIHSHPPPPHPHHKQQAGNNNLNANGNDDHHGYDKHPNEVVKNEELTYNSGTERSRLCKWNWNWNWIIAMIAINYR